MKPISIILKDWKRGQSLRSLITIPKSPLSANDGERQLDYIARYIEKAEVNPAAQRCALIEVHYIDRDFLEDCSAFYVHNLEPPTNYCTRIHFFACEKSDLASRLRSAWKAQRKQDFDKYNEICDRVSKELYLGYTVIRPLPGCPIGRTVLRCHTEVPASGGFRRFIPVARQYKAHVAGVHLKVSALAFQQQDRGVSACATVAIWSAFHRLQETDDVACPSPSRITRLATQYALPFGRSLPASEGLNVSQMCVAIELLQMSPTLISFKGWEPESCKQVIWSAVKSGYPPILILDRLGLIDERRPPSQRVQPLEAPSNGCHAATIAGVKQLEGDLLKRHQPLEQIKTDKATVLVYRVGQQIASIYMHDDRIGPYRRADIVDRSIAQNIAPLNVDALCSRPGIRVRLFSHSQIPVFEHWALSYLLLPVHPRIRIGIAELDRFAIHLCRNVVAPVLGAISTSKEFSQGVAPTPVVFMDSWLERGHKYQERVLTEPVFSNNAAAFLGGQAGLPRHVGIIRFAVGNQNRDVVDVLVDTTSNVPNERFLFVVASTSPAIQIIAEGLATLLGCELVF